MSATATRNRTKPLRLCNICRDLEHGLVLTILQQHAKGHLREEIDAYAVEELPNDSQTGSEYTLIKIAGREHVGARYECSAHGERFCQCRGYTRWGHCKHIESLVALRKRGRV